MLSTEVMPEWRIVGGMEEIVRVSLRLPKDLHAALVDQAQKDTRSLHGEILALLRKALEGPQGGHSGHGTAAR